MQTRTCSTCGEAKSESEFCRDNSKKKDGSFRNKGGRKSYCKTCSASMMRRWVATNKARNEERPPALTGTRSCSSCRDVHPVEFFTRSVGRKEGIDRRCRTCMAKQNKIFRMRNPAYYKKYRTEALAAYGDKCGCCGQSAVEFLTIDHMRGDGAAHRREIGRCSLYRWLKTAGYPKDRFQILCYNCNCSRGAYGYCPCAKPSKGELL